MIYGFVEPPSFMLVVYMKLKASNSGSWKLHVFIRCLPSLAGGFMDEELRLCGVHSLSEAIWVSDMVTKKKISPVNYQLPQTYKER